MVIHSPPQAAGHGFIRNNLERLEGVRAGPPRGCREALVYGSKQSRFYVNLRCSDPMLFLVSAVRRGPVCRTSVTAEVKHA